MDKVIKIYEAVNMREVKDAYASLQEAANIDIEEYLRNPSNQANRDYNEILKLNKEYGYVFYEGYLIQIKSDDNINDFKDYYKIRSKTKNVKEQEEISIDENEVRTTNRLILRVYNFLEAEELDYKEFRLIMSQLVNQSSNNTFPNRLLLDMIKNKGYVVIPYSKDLNKEYPVEITNFLIGQVILSLEKFGIVSRKILNTTNLFKDEFEE